MLRTIIQMEREYPMARFALPVKTTLQPGDCMFLPVYWFHQVESIGRSISVNYWRTVKPAERKEAIGKFLCGHTNRRAAKTC